MVNGLEGLLKSCDSEGEESLPIRLWGNIKAIHQHEVLPPRRLPDGRRLCSKPLVTDPLRYLR